MQDRITTSRARQTASPGSRPRQLAKPLRAPKPTAEQLDKQLRHITSAVLDALKNPAGIPSNIILAALKSARQL